MRPIVAVFGSSTTSPGSLLYDQGVECGRLLGEAGFDVATGGYGGLMEAVSKGASQTGATVYGVTAPECFPDRPGPNRFVDEEIPAPTITERIHTIVSMSAGFVVLDGSIGTLTEMLVAWNIAYIDNLSSQPTKPLVAVGERWAEVVPYLTERAVTNGDLITVVDGVEKAVRLITEQVSVG